MIALDKRWKVAQAFQRLRLFVSEGRDGQLLGVVPKDPRRTVAVELDGDLVRLRGKSLSADPDFISVVNAEAPVAAIAEVVAYILEQVNGSMADASYAATGEATLREAAEAAAGDHLNWVVPDPFKSFLISLDVTAQLERGVFDANEELTLWVGGRWLVASVLYIEVIERVQIAICSVTLS